MVLLSTLWRHRRSRRRCCCSSSSTLLFSKPPSQRCRWLERWGRCRATPGLQKSGARQLELELHTADRFNGRWPTLTCVCTVVQRPLPVADTQELSRVEGGGFQSFLYTAACFKQTNKCTHTQKKKSCSQSLSNATTWSLGKACRQRRFFKWFCVHYSAESSICSDRSVPEACLKCRTHMSIVAMLPLRISVSETQKAWSRFSF